MKYSNLSKPDKFSEKMLKLMNNVEKCSLSKSNTVKLNNLMEAAAIIEPFSYIVRPDTVEIHYDKISSNQIKSIKKISKQQRKILELTINHYSINEISFDIWSELGAAIRSCIIGDHRSVIRSLRWILESMLFWVNFQVKQEDIATTIYNDYVQEKFSEKEFLDLFNEIRITHRAKIEERVLMKEKYMKPSFGELVKDLEDLRYIDPKMIEHIKNELREAYTSYSSLSHISINTLQEFYNDKLRSDYAFFQSYEYNKKSFSKVVANLWFCIDLFVSFFTLTSVHFFSYKTCREFVDASTKYYGSHLFQKIYQEKKFQKKLCLFNGLLK